MYRVTRVQDALKGSMLATAVLALMVMTGGCGQDPSFTEQAATPTTAPDQSKDATGSSSDNGAGDSIAKASTGNSSDVSDIPAGVSATGAVATDRIAHAGDPNSSFQAQSVSDATIEQNNLTLMHDTSVLKAVSNVDILWVVDSSGSMAEEQSFLGSNFKSFIGQLAATTTDFQVGVTTTDICASQLPSTVAMNERWCPVLDGSPSTHLRGSLVGDANQRVLKRSTADLITRFTRYANVGINGSSFEHGLKAAEMAVAKSLAGQNEGLVRKDAFLAVIVVSDEEDDGIGLGMTDAFTGINYVDAGMTSARYTDTDFINYLGANKGAGMFSVSAITGTRLANGKMCTSPHSQPQEEGTQYIAAAKKTGGMIQSICDTNWSSSLASIGSDINAQSAQIVLTTIPYPGTIRVYVNGVENTQWAYNSGNNSIKFNAGQLPAAGSSVDIAYYHQK